MSDYNFNLASVKPVIRETANMNNDGGGGNLGYMQQGGEQEDENKKQKFSSSIFGSKGEDTFSFSSKPIYNIPEEDDGIFTKIVKFILRIFK